jgi:hypothetical protein
MRGRTWGRRGSNASMLVGGSRARVQETAEGEQPFTLDGLMEVPQAVRVTDEKLPFVTADRAYGAPAPLR